MSANHCERSRSTETQLAAAIHESCRMLCVTLSTLIATLTCSLLHELNQCFTLCVSALVTVVYHIRLT